MNLQKSRHIIKCLLIVIIINVHTLCSNLTLILVLVLTQNLPVVEPLPSMYKALSLYSVLESITSINSLFSPHSPLVTVNNEVEIGFLFSFNGVGLRFWASNGLKSDIRNSVDYWVLPREVRSWKSQRQMSWTIDLETWCCLSQGQVNVH